MKRVHILNSNLGDWSCLYIDGTEIQQNHIIGEGDNVLYLLRLAKEYNFTIDDVYEGYLSPEDEELLDKQGTLPYDMKDLNSKYK